MLLNAINGENSQNNENSNLFLLINNVNQMLNQMSTQENLKIYNLLIIATMNLIVIATDSLDTAMFFNPGIVPDNNALNLVVV